MEVEAEGCDKALPVVRIPVELPYDAVPTSCYTLNIDEMKLSITFIVPKDSNPGDKITLVTNVPDDYMSADDGGNNETDAIEAIEFNKLLDEAINDDLTAIEKTGCVKYGFDLDDLPIVTFLPKLGFNAVNNEKDKDTVLRKMLLLLLKTINELVHDSPFSIVYGYAPMSILNQQPIIYKYWKMLPRKYKKNLAKLYVIHPQLGIKMFFELSRVFVSQKFYQKLLYLDYISDFQALIPPTLLALPSSYIRFEDSERGWKPIGVMPPLARSFDNALGTTKLIADCCSFIRLYGLKRKGLFRIAGDESLLSLVKTRLYNTVDGTSCVIIGEDRDSRRESCSSFASYSRVNSNSSATSTVSATYGSMSSTISNMTSALSTGKKAGKNSSNIQKISTILIQDIDTVAQTLKLSIRDLPEPLITADAYDRLIKLTSLVSSDISMLKITDEIWEQEAVAILGTMPLEHKDTLLNLLKFLAEVSVHSADNLMDCSNLSIVFTPTVMSTQCTDPMEALKEMKLGQTIVTKLITKCRNELMNEDKDPSASNSVRLLDGSSDSIAYNELEKKLSVRMQGRITSGRFDRDTSKSVDTKPITPAKIDTPATVFQVAEDSKFGNRNMRLGGSRPRTRTEEHNVDSGTK